jgi:metal-responsive CopG/Arc/MetJ family transcriptional regulator
MSKIAITIPEDQMRALERLRRKRRLPRSRIVQQALRFYFAHEGLTEEAAAYEDAYRRVPEREPELQSLAALAAEALGGEDWS